MPFRYNKILKFLAILLFSFEMLAPAVLVVTPEIQTERQTAKGLNESDRSIDFLTNLIFEEVSSEGREGKNDCLIGISFIELFSALQKFEPIQLTRSLHKEHFDTHPPLFTLHRVLLI
jgi:hypothetical protein